MQQESLSFWYPSTQRRVLAILLSAVLPGTGQLVLGRRGWALIWAGAPLLAMALVPTFGPWAAATVLLLRLPASAQAAFMRGGGVAPDPTGKIVALAVLLFVGTMAVMTQLRHDVVESVTLVDATMYPSLETGDYVVVDKVAYGLRVPFIGRVHERPARLGDLVAVDDPDKPDQLIVGRVVALGPTTFEMKDGAIVLGPGKEIVRAPLETPCQFAEVDKDKHEFVDRPCTLFEEQAGGRTWRVVGPPVGDKAPSTAQPRQLAAGQILVAQDNRRGAAPWKIVPASDVRGRVNMVWFSTAGPRGIRWDRAGKRLP